MPRLWALATAAAAVLLWSSCVLAQTSPVAAVAGYQGADRQQRLLEGAKREKELTIYWSIPPGDIAALMAGFDKKYGIGKSATFRGRYRRRFGFRARAALPRESAGGGQIAVPCRYLAAGDSPA